MWITSLYIGNEVRLIHTFNVISLPLHHYRIVVFLVLHCPILCTVRHRLLQLRFVSSKVRQIHTWTSDPPLSVGNYSHCILVAAQGPFEIVFPHFWSESFLLVAVWFFWVMFYLVHTVRLQIQIDSSTTNNIMLSSIT